MDAKEYIKVIHKKQEVLERKILLAIKEFERDTSLSLEYIEIEQSSTVKSTKETISVRTQVIL